MDCVRLTNPMCTWPFEAFSLPADLRNICSGLTFSQKAECRIIPILNEAHTTAQLLEYASPQVLASRSTMDRDLPSRAKNNPAYG